MHSNGSNDPASSGNRRGPSLSVPSAGSPGDLTVLQRLEAFRDLVRHGHALLGEVVSYCRQAEEALTQIAAEKQSIDTLRSELEDARSRADQEAAAARAAMAQVEKQSAELGQIREELMRAQSTVAEAQRLQNDNAHSLEQSLHDSREQQRRLEEELRRVRGQSVPPQALADVADLKRRLEQSNQALEQTRKDLETERSRRNRALSMIKPRAVDTDGEAANERTPSP